MVVSSTYYKSLDNKLPNSTNKIIVGSKILSISINNFTSEEDLKNPVSLYFDKQDVKANHTRMCSFWDFTMNEGGNWSQSGCNTTSINDSFTTCECYHMTNFAILVSLIDPVPEPQIVLEIMSIVGCILSIICMIITLIVYFSLWPFLKKIVRGNMTKNILLMDLCVVLIAANIIFLACMEMVEPRELCVAIAAILQFLFLAAFGVMLALGIHSYKKVVSLAHGMSPDTTKELVLLHLLAYGCPLIIVGSALGITNTKGYGNEYFCWLSVQDGLIWSFIGPVIAVSVINIIIMVLVLTQKVKSQIFNTKRSQSAKKDKKKNRKDRRIRNKEILRSTFWSLVVMVPLMGSNWILGLFAVSKETQVFQYLFTLLNATQGVFLFIFHCFLDVSVQKAWFSRFGIVNLETSDRLRRKLQPSKNKGYDMSTSESGTMSDSATYSSSYRKIGSSRSYGKPLQDRSASKKPAVEEGITSVEIDADSRAETLEMDNIELSEAPKKEPGTSIEKKPPKHSKQADESDSDSESESDSERESSFNE